MGTRTPDLLITNQLLYQLSYAGLLRWAVPPAPSRAGGTSDSSTVTSRLKPPPCGPA
jgi:hypothetical protein